MTRNTRSAYDAHQYLTGQAMQRSAIRADWHDVLTARDTKRAARRASIARRQSRRMSGHISRALILCLILTCALAMGVTAWQSAQRAVSVIVSHQV